MKILRAPVWRSFAQEYLATPADRRRTGREMLNFCLTGLLILGLAFLVTWAVKAMLL